MRVKVAIFAALLALTGVSFEPTGCLAKNETGAPRAVADLGSDRALKFPERASLGVLFWIPPGTKVDVSAKHWKMVGQAKGVVHVPKGMRLALELGFDGAGNPSLLTAYGADFLAALDCSKAETDDATLETIGKLTGLLALDLRDSDFTDDGLRCLGHLKKLKDLHLSRTNLSDRGLANLLPLSSLEELSLSKTRIDDEGLKIVKKLVTLKSLSLTYVRLTDAGVAHLAALPELTAVELDGNRGVTAQGLMQLRPLKKLTRIGLYDTGITAKDLGVMKKLSKQMPSLKIIALSDKSFSHDKLVEWRRQLAPLVVDVEDPRVSNEDAQKLFAPLHSWSDR